MRALNKYINKYKTLSIAAKAAMAYMVASLFTKGLGIITTPIFTRIMSTAEIGEFNTFSSWYSMISVVATLSLSSGSFSLAMFEFNDRRDQYSSTMISLSTLSAFIAAGIYFVNPTMWNSIFSLNSVEMCVMILAFIFIPATEYRIVRLRYEYKYKTLISISLFNAIFGTILAVLTVLVARNHNVQNLAQIRIVGLYTVLCLTGVYNYIYILRRGKKIFVKEFCTFVAINNTPLIANSFAKHVLEVSDRTMITNMVGKSETGIYSILYTVSTLSIIVWSAIEANLLPYIFENLRNNTTEKIRKVLNPLLLFFAGVCLSLTLIAPEIVKILATDEYYASIYIMPPVACGVFFTAVYNVFGDILLYHKKTKYILLATSIAAGSNILLNYFGIQLFGYFAAAYTTLISYLILGLTQYIAMKKVHPEKIYDIRFICIISGCLIVLSLICMSLYSHVAIRYALVCILIIFVFVFRKKILSDFCTIKRKGK